MYNTCWQYFKKTGSIDAYLYLHDRKKTQSVTNMEDVDSMEIE